MATERIRKYETEIDTKKRYSVKKIGQREVEKDNEGDRFYISYNTISSVPWKEDSEAKQPTYLVSSTIVSSS